MYRLLDAGFERIKKNKVFFGCIIATIGIAIFMLVSNYLDMKNYNAEISTSELISNYLPMIGIFIAVFSGLFVGTEYSDGTIRNKIIAGHKKINIYLSNFIISSIVSILFQIIWTIFVLIIAVPVFGKPIIELNQLLITSLDSIMFIIAYSAIFNFISVLSCNKTISSVTCILLFFIMLGVTASLFNIIQTPETVQRGGLNPDTGVVSFEEVPNPHYPSDAKRQFYQTIVDIIPMGQAFSLGARLPTNIYMLPIYSLALIVVFNGTGIYLFNKKDLN
jgi:ABC-2 type transport system permease protein